MRAEARAKICLTSLKMQCSHHCEHLLERLNKQREVGFLCDCTIIIGEFQFKAHRNVLASFSEYFGALYRDTSESNVFLDQNQVKADGFQKLLEFIYTGDLSLDSWNVKEIHQAADYLKVEEVVTKCKIKMEDFAFIANPSSTEISSITGNIALNQQTCLLTLRDYNSEEKLDAPSVDPIQSPVLTATLEKKSAQTKKRKKAFSSPKNLPDKPIQYPNDVTENTAVEMFLDANKLATEITEQAAQGGDNSELQLTPVVESETFAAQEILIQTMAMKPKRGKVQQGCALKEHCLSNITSDKNSYQLESSGEELDQKYSKAKPVCNTCGKVFSEASSLRRHMRIHKGVKPYVCQLCGKAFTQCNQLKTHVRTHTGEKPYICGICGKSFISSGELSKHFRSHTGERPFICELCGNSYTDIKNLKKHKAKVHTGSENALDPVTLEHSFNDQDSIPSEKSPLLESADVKPSDIALSLPTGTEDHQVLLPVTDSQSPPSDTLLRSTIAGYSEPQFIFLQQLY
ncbi:hypothetical protein JD844_007569 [Phrynosoma platyrhinos]|uniref:Myoneurin n=1 Tax=Phrynosoma platyrhinos TaxID=52577 RepID=A0ABQ7T3R1_PHRPL|nr:hypothetical protein JD844_007569 [Phrynosoma platyrhinos]